MRNLTQVTQQHYRSDGLLERILAGLRAAGKNPEAPTVEDLAPADEFHSLGRAATRELAELAQIAPGTRLLDVGSGLGGPARYLASACGCDVTGIDLTPEFCEVANELSRRTGLAGRSRFRQADALALPFAEGEFDAVWTFQTQMNIADKRRFYAEIRRVLRPGGRLMFQDILEGNGRALEFPVPWASEADCSHLIKPNALRDLLRELGLIEVLWRDATAAIVEWQARNIPPKNAPLPPLGMHLVLGPLHAEKRANANRALRDGRFVYIQGVFEKTR